MYIKFDVDVNEALKRGMEPGSVVVELPVEDLPEATRVVLAEMVWRGKGTRQDPAYIGRGRIQDAVSLQYGPRLPDRFDKDGVRDMLWQAGVNRKQLVNEAKAEIDGFLCADVPAADRSSRLKERAAALSYRLKEVVDRLTRIETEKKEQQVRDFLSSGRLEIDMRCRLDNKQTLPDSKEEVEEFAKHCTSPAWDELPEDIRQACVLQAEKSIATEGRRRESRQKHRERKWAACTAWLTDREPLVLQKLEAGYRVDLPEEVKKICGWDLRAQLEPMGLQCMEGRWHLTDMADNPPDEIFRKSLKIRDDLEEVYAVEIWVAEKEEEVDEFGVPVGSDADEYGPLYFLRVIGKEPFKESLRPQVLVTDPEWERPPTD